MELGDHLALCQPANPYKWPLEFSHLSCQKCSKGFHHQPPHWSLCIHTKPTEKKDLTVGAELSTNNASRLQVWAPQSRKYQTSRDRLLAGRSGNPALCEVKGRGHLVCALQRADGSVLLSNVSQDRLAILRRELGAYILAVRLFMYLPWFFNWVSPYTKNLPHIPQIQMEQGEITAKGGNSRDFLELWICHMLCKNLLAKRRLGLLCEKYCAWEVKNCNRASQSIMSDRQLYLPHLRCSNMHFGTWSWHRALFTANANVLFILKKKLKSDFALLIQNPIIIFLLKKKSHASIMLLHRFIQFRQRNIVRWKYTVADRDSLIQWLVLPYHTT